MQRISQKAAEVKFRERITPQHLGKTYNFPQEWTAEQMLEEIKKRLEATKTDFKNLDKKGINFSPFLEIGAEYGTRATWLKNHFGVEGIICDISRDALVAAHNFAKKLNLGKTPARICCDGENLPFAKNSFSFVFCYQTLHHFENPGQLISEIIRVTKPDGRFFFSEEPVKQLINLNLWRRPTVLRSFEKLLKSILILPFISTIGKTESDFGIFEGTFDLASWGKILAPFDKIQIKVKPFPAGPESNMIKNSRLYWIQPNLVTRITLALFGGGITGLAKITKEKDSGKIQKLDRVLICPECKLEGREAPLKKTENSFYCQRCNRNFKKYLGVLGLLPKNLAQKLYGQT